MDRPSIEGKVTRRSDTMSAVEDLDGFIGMLRDPNFYLQPLHVCEQKI